MQNVEFKAELRDLDIACRVCKLIGAKRIGTLDHIDTYFKMPDGRLKRRECNGEPVEWIFYHRNNVVRPKLSNFTILSERQARTRWGTDNLRQWLQVRKRRELWLIDNTRIHLDIVDGLGLFIEFEALVSSKYDVRECHAIIQHLRQEFSVALGEPISVSYSDLIAQERSEAGANDLTP